MRVANCVKGSSPVAIYAALFFDPRGRPGPRRRLRWRRPFVARVGVEKLPSNDCIAARTSCCTSSRITVNKLLCLGINASLVAADTRRRPPGKGSSICLASSGESCWRCSGGTPAFRQIGTRGADTCGYAECAVGAVWRAPAGRAVVGACISCAPRSGAADDAPPLRRASAGEPAAGTALWTFGRDPRPLGRSPPDSREESAVLLFWALVVQDMVVATAPTTLDRSIVVTSSLPARR
jgi:hypothetical protein